MKLMIQISIFLVLVSCSNLFYHPDRYLYIKPELLKLTYEDRWFESRDGTDLNAWYIRSKVQQMRPKGLVVFFHGNAQNISAHYISLVWLVDHGYDILIADYRGYGRSSGKPTQEGVYKDSLAMLDEGWKLFNRDHHKQFIVYGQSLGGAVAMRAHKDFEHKNKIDLLVLDSTFISYKGVAWSVATNHWLTIPFSPFVWLFTSDHYTAKNYLPKIQTPTLVIHSKNDQVIPISHGNEIYKSLTSKKKWFWKLEKTGHIRTFDDVNKKNRPRFLSLLSTLDK